jgi:hypothetical protein
MPEALPTALLTLEGLILILLIALYAEVQVLLRRKGRKGEPKTLVRPPPPLRKPGTKKPR